ncbi:NADPH:quinone reductase [Streptomyces sp. H10-C2]|uniref:NADPH:quinone reductase n=1 Tax=unclassified Streptomyces TaxID=2593676 RepID=UPI0024BB8824|nr:MULTISPECIES: NADPH:quinone reductase [unclassified Streptomyces]MDJ0341219.1 NADPH:quinone reductase [Streptomyces sp. PH10-H1]MDJ0369428.1 NADPH:quinone reductase [Streptomyces sp. H10-C2]
MKAIVHTSSGGPDVLSLTERPIPEPGPGDVRVRVHVSGVNPTDWKSRQGAMGGPGDGAEQVPNQDGAGVIDAVGEGVAPERLGQRVWIWEAAWRRSEGTAQEYVVLPDRQAVLLPDAASFDLGASLGIPALTAHRTLTVADGGPDRLAPGSLEGRTVLVAGGAGAVGNAAIQLARWAGATVVTTVSSPRKADLARAAGAHHVVDYRTEDATEAIRRVAPKGVDIIVEVAPAVNAVIDHAVAAPNAVIAFYANTGGEEITVPVREAMMPNLRWQGVLVYTVPDRAKTNAVADVSAAVAAGALRVGEDAGLPLHRFPLEKTGDAHTAVENSAVGKVLIDVFDGAAVRGNTE